MQYDAEDFEKRAEECVRLANQTPDGMVQQKLLLLRQDYLATAERLRSFATKEMQFQF